METLNSKVIDMLKKESSVGSGVAAYMMHIKIDLDKVDGNKDLNKLKTEIMDLVEKHFPVREEILPFTVCKEEAAVLEFSIQKTLAVV